jgi:hypothetical protein
VVDQLEYNDSWYKDASKESGGWTLEQINPFTDCIGINNFSASTANFGGTPGIQNSVYDTLPDTIPPVISNVSVLSQDSVLVSFSEYMDSTTIENGTYTFNTSAVVGQVFNQPPAYTSALLVLSTPLDSGILHTITISGVADCAGNLINSNNQNDLVIPAIPNYRDVVINELFPDFNPSIGLPQAEFIELFNASDKIFDLSGWSLGELTPDDDLVSEVFQPGNYIIVCDQSDEMDFQLYGNTMGLGSIPNLLNDGTQLTLFDAEGNVIDHVSYTKDSYQDVSKDDGGWTLEQINPSTECSGKSNFIASNNLQGGTPGTQNSVFDTLPDTSSPVLEAADVLSADSVLLSFSERIDTTSALNANYSFNTGVVVGSVENIFPDYDQVLLILNNPLDSGVINTITVTNLTDCPGNQIGSQNQADIVVPAIPSYRDIVINEFMCDPSAGLGLPDADFIELYNASQKIFDLSDWTISNGSAESTIENLVFKPGEYIIICPKENESAFLALGSVIGLASFPSLTATGDEIILKDPKGRLIDYVNFSERWYRDCEKRREEGYGLEQINPNLACSGNYNFIASGANSGGTPGQQNSVFTLQDDLRPPNLKRILVHSEDTIELRFDEGIDTTLLNVANFNFSIPNGVSEFIFNSLDASRVLLGLNTPLDSGKTTTLTITNLPDCSGNAVKPTTIDFALPEKAKAFDIVVNEILFNPKTDGSDFVELYNRSQKIISLEGWMLANWDDRIANREVILNEPYLLFPGAFLGITSNLDNVVCDYPNTVVSNFIEVDRLPTYSNEEGGVYILNSSNNLIDGFRYDEDQHFELLNDEDGVSLERIDPDRASDDQDNFHSAAESVGFATPGYENSQYFANTRFSGEVTIDPETISPDNDGYQDVVNINYQFDAPGYVANVNIYDRSGRLIKSLVDNELLGSKGSFTWDGITDENSKARVGVYIVFFEAFNPSGDKQVFKKTLVVAAYLD